MTAAAGARQGDIEFLDGHETLAGERAAGDRGRRATVAGARIGEIDQPVLRELGVQRDVEQPTLAAVAHVGRTGDRLRVEPAIGDDAKATWTLGHEHPSVGQEGETPGVFQALDHLHQTEPLLGGFVDAEGVGRGERAERNEHHQRQGEQRGEATDGRRPNGTAVRHDPPPSPVARAPTKRPQASSRSSILVPYQPSSRRRQ